MKPKAEATASTVRRLVPSNTSIFVGTFSLLHCTVAGDTLYRAVFAVRLFPISHPDGYISLRYTDPLDDKVHEIGVIEDLAVFPPEQQQLVRNTLAKQYHELVITRVHDVRNEHGLLFFDVETNRGRVSFVMPWSGDRAEEYGEHGKLLRDALDNRYIIRDLSALPAVDQNKFTAFIYW